MSPNLTNLEYDSRNFSDLYETKLGRELWHFMRRSDNVVRMATASFLRRPAVEPLSPGLFEEFGPAVGEDRLKQMIGHMARQVMEAVGYRIEQPRRSIRITRENLFSSGARYRRPGDNRARRPPREPPRKGGVLDALRRSPLVGADVIPPRPFESGREVEL